MISYCVAFMVKDERVLLIRKSKPAWQKGRLNGVGGKIEENEWPYDAMSREFYEETGIKLRHNNFELFVHMIDVNREWEIFFYRGICDIDSAQSMEEELLEIIKVDEIFKQKTIPNLRWLIPLSLDQTVHFPIEIIDENK